MTIAPSTRLIWFAAAVMLPLATVAGFTPRIAPLCMGGLAACALLLAYDAFGGIARVRSIHLSVPDILRLTKDVATTVPVTVDNRSGITAPIRLAAPFDEAVKEADVPAGRSTIDWPFTARRRGDSRIEALDLEVVSPLGFWMARTRQSLGCTLRVYPNLRDRATAGLFLKTANVGLRIHRQIGKGREFENLRQYMPGDSFEDIHWKATAKRNFPAVKLFRVEHAQELYAVIDASRLSAREGILEGYIDAALHLALVAERQGDRFGLVTFSDRTHRFIRARSGLAHFRLCREAIYNLRAQRVSPDFREVFTNIQLNLRRRSLLVFFTSLDDALLAENFERDIPLLSRRHLVLVNVTRTAAMQELFTGDAPQNIDALYSGLAGQMLSNRMRRLKIALQNRGVRLAVMDPARIKLEVTSQYLDVKRRQVL
jgi:uncharacterized protein (DUF58 family)